MKALVYLMALTAGLCSAAIAQNANPQSGTTNLPQRSAAPVVQGNRDPGAKSVVVPADNPGSTSVDHSNTEGSAGSNQTSDRAISRDWQGLGSTGGGTGTGMSSGTTADEVAPGQDGNRPANAGTDNGQQMQQDGSAQDNSKVMRQNSVKPMRE